MRLVLATFFSAFALFGAVAAYTQLISNSRYLDLSAKVLQDWAASRPQLDSSAVVKAAIARAELYDDLVQQTHLVDGMVVNRGRGGTMLDQCDSLLFSSLRYVGLEKLKLANRADAAWRGIQAARGQDGWARHPLCRSKGTSRDMLLGLLVAFSQEPQGFDTHLRDLIEQVHKSGGFFGSGPVYVSYLTPGIARLMAMLAPAGNLPERELPPILQSSYATHELTLYATRRGYEAHLVALTVWLDMELSARHPRISDRVPSSVEDAVGRLVRPFASGEVKRQRIEWATHQLAQIDSHNLFFRYLRLRASNALTPQVASALLTELMVMPQFPPDRLPNTCDRRADYLWQRASREFAPSNATPFRCSREFNGSDFLWMAGLLVEASLYTAAPKISH